MNLAIGNLSGSVKNFLYSVILPGIIFVHQTIIDYKKRYSSKLLWKSIKCTLIIDIMVNTSPDNISANTSRNEINDYYVNYIADVTNEQLEIKEKAISKLDIQQNSHRLEVSELMEEVV